MRKHCPRKLLHACLDLLPVVLIPVFMIYSHRHDLTTNSPSVDIRRKYNTNEVSTWDDFVDGNAYLLSFSVYSSFNTSNTKGSILSNYVTSHSEYEPSSNYSFSCHFGMPYILNNDKPLELSFDAELSKYEGFTYESTIFVGGYTHYSSLDYVDMINLNVGSSITVYEYITNRAINVFGFSTTQSNVTYYAMLHYDMVLVYHSDFYSGGSFVYNNSAKTFILSHVSSLTDEFNPITSADVSYGDTVTNVFMTNFSTTVNTYLNFGNVFNLNGMWNWINTNIFGGTANAFVYALWNIIVYEFVMDLLFLFYMFFMFLIDFTENLLEKPFDKINRG